MTSVILQIVMSPEEVAELGWQERALCAETDPEAFYPEKGGSTREAKQVCRCCEVRAECLDYALKHGERFGIWGGMSERERRRLGLGSAPAKRGRPAAPSSRFRGVTWSGGSGKWRARAVIGGERIQVGLFADEEEAGRAVAEAESTQPRKAAALCTSPSPPPQQAIAGIPLSLS